MPFCFHKVEEKSVSLLGFSRSRSYHFSSGCSAIADSSLPLGFVLLFPLLVIFVHVGGTPDQTNPITIGMDPHQPFSHLPRSGNGVVHGSLLLGKYLITGCHNVGNYEN